MSIALYPDPAITVALSTDRMGSPVADAELQPAGVSANSTDISQMGFSGSQHA